MKLFAIFGLALLSFSAQAQGQPKDVEALVKRIASCNHFAGEEGYDAQRRREIAAAMKASRCATVVADEAKLLKKYERNKKLIDTFEAARQAP